MLPMLTRIYRWWYALPPYLYQGVLVAFVALLFILGSQEAAVHSIPPLFPNMDKVCHFLAFSFVAKMAWFGFRNHRVSACVFLPMIIGLADELHQATLPFRTADPMDWLTDTLAGLVVVICLKLIHKTAYPEEQ